MLMSQQDKTTEIKSYKIRLESIACCDIVYFFFCKWLAMNFILWRLYELAWNWENIEVEQSLYAWRSLGFVGGKIILILSVKCQAILNKKLLIMECCGNYELEYYYYYLKSDMEYFAQYLKITINIHWSLILSSPKRRTRLTH